MKAVQLLVLLLLTSACLPSLPAGRAAGAGPQPVPAPSRAALFAAGTRADDARAAGFAGEAVSLGTAFAGQALTELTAAVAHLRALDQRVERRLDVRRLVHWSISAGIASGVLAISGWSRLLSQGVPTPWSPFLEQWAFQLGWSGAWRVTEAAEVPPEAWWQ